MGNTITSKTNKSFSYDQQTIAKIIEYSRDFGIPTDYRTASRFVWHLRQTTFNIPHFSKLRKWTKNGVHQKEVGRLFLESIEEIALKNGIERYWISGDYFRFVLRDTNNGKERMCVGYPLRDIYEDTGSSPVYLHNKTQGDHLVYCMQTEEISKFIKSVVDVYYIRGINYVVYSDGKRCRGDMKCSILIGTCNNIMYTEKEHEEELNNALSYIKTSPPILRIIKRYTGENHYYLA